MGGVWKDKSANKIDAPTACTGGVLPVVDPTPLNGQPVLLFGSSGNSGVLLNRFDTVVSSLPLSTMVGLSKRSTTGAEMFFDFRLATGGNVDDVAVGVGSGEVVARYGGNSKASVMNRIVLSASTAANGWAQSMFFINSTAHTLRINGGQNQGSCSTSGVCLPITVLTTSNIRLGCENSNAGMTYFHGSIAEAALYSRMLTDCEQRDIDEYMRSRYALGTTLIPSTPCMSSPTPSVRFLIFFGFGLF